MKRITGLAVLVPLMFLLASPSSRAQVSNWNVNATGMWTNPANWSGGAYPNGIDQVAAFTNGISAARHVTNDVTITLGTLIFGDTLSTYNAFQLVPSGSGSFVFDVSSGYALISKRVSTALDTNRVNMVLNDDLIVSNATTANLTLNGRVDGAGRTVILEGSGVAQAGRTIFGVSNNFANLIIRNGASFYGKHIDSAGGASITIDNGGQFFMESSGNVTNTMSMSGDGWQVSTVIGKAGALRLGNNTNSGPITLNGDTRIAAYNASGVVNSVLSGPVNLAFGYTGADTAGGRVTLTAANSYRDTTIETNQELRIGAGGTTGTLGTGTVTNWGRLSFERSDDVLLTNLIVGTGALQKRGAGTLTIMQENVPSTAGSLISAGTVALAGDGSLGTGAIEFSGNAAVRSLDATARVLTNALTLTSGFTTSGDGDITFLGAINNGAGAKLLTVSNALTTVLGAMSNTGTFGKRGPGQLVLGATMNASAFTNMEGLVSLGAGGIFTNAAATITLLPNTLFDVTAATNAFTVQAGQILRGSGSLAGDATTIGTVTPGLSAGTLSFSNHATFANATLNFELAAAGTVGGGVNDLIAVASNLTFTGISTVRVSAVQGNMAAGYTLFTYGGALAGGAAALTLVPEATLRPGYAFAFDDATPNALNLNMTTDAGAALTWAATSNVWDIGGSVNWSGSEKFYNSDTVTFDNAGGDSNIVTLTGSLMPRSVTVAGDSNYTFAGTGKIGGSTGLTKTGPGVLTIATTNDYAGDTAIQGGMIKLGTTVAIPNNSKVTVSDGAAFDFGGFAPGSTRTNTFVVAGNGGDGLGAIRDSGANIGINANSGIQSLRMTGNATVGTAGRFDIGLASAAGTWLDGGGYALTKVGTGTNDIRVQVMTNVAAVYVNEGVLRYEGYDRTEASLAGTTNFVASGAALEVYGPRTMAMPVVLNGGALRSVNSIQTWTTPLRVDADSFVAPSASCSITNAGEVSGSGKIYKIGAGTWVLAASNSFSGGLVITGGVVVAANNDALSTGGVELRGTVSGTRMHVAPGVTVTNSLLIDRTDPATGNGALHVNTAGVGTWAGPITVVTSMVNGGHFAATGGGTLWIAGPIYQGGGFTGAIGIRQGDIVLAGGGDYSAMYFSQGDVRLGASDGVSTSAWLTIGNSAAAGLNMAGFNQTLSGLNKSGNAANVWNTNATPSTLTLAIGLSSNCVYAGVVSGNVNVAKIGAGVLTMSGVGYHTGVTSVREGTLLVENRLALQNSTVSNTIANGTVFTNSTSYVFGGLAGSADLALQTYLGSAVQLIVGKNDQDTLFSGTLGGIGSLVKMGNGALTLTSAGAYPGGTTLSNGYIRLTADNLLPGALTFSGGGISSDSGAARLLTNAVTATVAPVFGDGVNNGTITLSGLVNLGGGARTVTNFADAVLTGSTTNGGFNTKRGPATLTLKGGVHDWRTGGALLIENGAIVFDNCIVSNNDAFRVAGELAGVTARLVVTNGAWVMTTNRAANLRIGYTGGSATATNIADIAGTLQLITGAAGGLVQIGTSSAKGILNLLPSGNLIAKHVEHSGNTSELNFDGGKLTALQNDIGFITNLTAAYIRSGGGTIDSSGFSVTVPQQLLDGGGAGGLTKQGLGTLRMTASNTYVGTTRIVAGLLSLEGSGAVDRSAVLQIDSGAVLASTGLVSTMHLATNQTLKGGGTFVGGLIADAGSKIAPGASPGTLTVEGALTMDAASTYEVELQATNDFDRLVFSGVGAALTLNSPELVVTLLPGYTPVLGDTFAIVSGLAAPVGTTFNGKPDDSEFTVSGTVLKINYNDGNDITLTVVPEPASLGLFGVLGAAMLLRRRLRG